jgi:hypothetical protein
MPQIPQFLCSHPYCLAAVSQITKLWLVLCIISGHRQQRKYISQQFFHCVMQLSRGPCREHCFPVSSLVCVRNLLPSNRHCLQSGSTFYIASSLRLFVLNSLQVYCHFFFSESFACDICDRPHLPSPWLSSHGHFSPSAFTAPFLTLSLWWLSPLVNLSLWRYFLNFKMLSNYIIPCKE